MWLAILFGGTAALFLAMTCVTLFHLRRVGRLPALAALGAAPGGGRGPVRCSVVVAARDEADRVGGTVRRLLVQEGVTVEVVVVDDRSTDRTGEIVGALAAEDPRVRPVRVDALPDGWLGKCHACHVGAEAAAGEWILFTDADCWLTPDAIARAVRVADRDAADHVALTPGIARTATPAARAWHLAFLASLAGWVAGVNRDRPRAYLGMGAFNLVRAATYRRSGGYAALRLTVLDDVRLGLVLRRAGARTRGFVGGDDADCHWGTTLPAVVRVMEKNYFAALDFRLAPALVLGLVGPLVWAAAVVGPFTGTVAGVAAGTGLLSLAVPAAVLSRRLGWPAAGALLTPFIYPAMFYAILRSAVVTVRQGGVRWRGTFYPLSALRAGAVR